MGQHELARAAKALRPTMRHFVLAGLQLRGRSETRKRCQEGSVENLTLPEDHDVVREGHQTKVPTLAVVGGGRKGIRRIGALLPESTQRPAPHSPVSLKALAISRGHVASDSRKSSTAVQPPRLCSDTSPAARCVEGLSYFRDESCVDQLEVQTDDFKQPTLGAVIRRKPFLFQRLRKFKRRECNLALLGTAAVVGVDLDRLLGVRRPRSAHSP
jgi:hypothetical protein